MEVKNLCRTIAGLSPAWLCTVMQFATSDPPSVCDPELPDAGEIWGGVAEKSGEWLDQARGAM